MNNTTKKWGTRLDDLKFIVTKENIGKRLDAYVSSLKDNISRSNAQKLIKNNKIVVNGKNVKESYKVKENDEIRIIIEEPKKSSLKPENIPLDII